MKTMEGHVLEMHQKVSLANRKIVVSHFYHDILCNLKSKKSALIYVNKFNFFRQIKFTGPAVIQAITDSPTTSETPSTTDKTIIPEDATTTKESTTTNPTRVPTTSKAQTTNTYVRSGITEAPTMVDTPTIIEEPTTTEASTMTDSTGLDNSSFHYAFFSIQNIAN